MDILGPDRGKMTIYGSDFDPERGCLSYCCDKHGVQRKMISVDNFFVFLRLLFFALLMLYVT